MEDVGSLVVKIAMDNSNFQQGVQNLNRSMKVIQSEFKNATSGLKEHGKGLEGLKAKQEMLSKSIDVQSKIVQKYKDKLKESKENLNKNAEAQAKLKDKIEDAKKAYEESKQVLGENNAKTKELKKAYENLSSEYAKNEDKLRNNVRAVDNWTTKANNAESKLKGMKQSLNSVSSSIQQQESKWNKLSQKLDSIGKKFEAVGKKMSAIGKSMSTKLTAPITAIGVLAGKLGMDFEQSISKVSSLSGATGDSLKQLENKAREMGSRTSKSAKDAADGMGFLALSGMKNKEMLEAIEPVLRLSEAANMDLARASSLTTDSMSALGVSTKDLPHYLDIVAQSARNSNTNIDEMMEGYISCGGIMKTLKVPLGESALYIDMLANKGIKGAESGTALNAVITNLTAPLGRAKDKLKELGISAFDSHGKFKGLTNVFMELKKKTDKMTDAQKNATLAAIGGKEHVKDLSAILGGLNTDYDKLKKAVNSSNGALNEMAKTMQNNNKGSITALKSALEEVGLKIYDVLKPAIAKVVTLLQNFTNKLNSISPATQQLIIKIAGVVAALGPILLVGAKLNTGIGKIIGSISKFSTAMSAGSSVAKAAMMALGGPATLITAGIMALVAGGIALYVNWDKIKAKAGELKQAISDKWNGIKESTSNTWNSMTSCISNSCNSVKNGTAGAWNNLKDSTVNCWDSVKNSVSNSITNLKNSIINTWTSIKTGVANIISNMVAEFLEKFNDQAHLLADVLERIKHIFMDYWEAIKTVVLGVVLIICDIVTGNFDKLKSDSAQIMDKLKGLIANIWDNIKNAILNTCTAIKEIASKIWHDIKEKIINKATEIKSKLNETWDNIKNYISNTLNNLKTTCSNAWENIKTTTATKWNEILNWFSTLPARLRQKGSEMFESMKQGIDNKLTNIKTSCKNIGTSILNAFRDIPKQALEIGKNIIDGLWHGITSGAGKVVDAAKNLGNSIASKIRETLDIHSPSRVMAEIGKFVDEGLAVGIENNKHLVENKAQNLANSVLKEVSKVSNSNVDLKVNVSVKDIENNTRHILNWGEKNKKTYKEFIDFVNKLNQTEVVNSKELLEKDYKNRVKNLEDKLRVVKTNSAKELQIKKDNINKQIAEYQRLIRNTKSKDNRKSYTDKIANLKAYQTKVLDSFKSTKQAEINSLEVSKRALKDYYTLANNLLNKRSETVKNNLKTTENVFKDKLNNFSVAIKKLSIDTDNLNSKLEHQKAIVIIQAQKINVLKNRYTELCNTLGATSEQAISMKKAFEDANNEMTNMAKNVESTNAEMRDKAVQDVDKLNSFILKALERKVKAEEKAALETAKIKAKEHNMSKEQLEKFLAYVKSIYEKKLNQDVLQGQAEQLIMSKNQKAIVQLLNSYGHLYEDAGISLGQKLVMGTKSWTDVLPPLISNCMENVVGTVGQASNSMGQSLSNVMEQIADVARAGQELASAAAGTGGKINFDFDFNFDSVYKNWESSIDNVETKSENVAEKISNKYKEAFNRIELAQIELNKTTKNADEELKKQQDLLDTQKNKLDTLKSKYDEMRSALGDSDDEVVQLKKDIASLTVEIENNTNNLAINKIKESYKKYADEISKEDKELSLREIKNAKDREAVEQELFLNKFSNLEALKDTYRELKEVLGENADEVKQLASKILDAQKDLKEVGNTTAKNIINSTFKNALEEIEQEEIKLNKETENVNSEFERQDKIIENKAKKLEILKQKFKELNEDGYIGENDEATISTKKDILNLEIEIANSRLKLQKDIDAKAKADADVAAQRSKQAFDDYINSIKNKYARLQEELEIATMNLSRETFNADSALEVQKSLLEKQKTTLKYLKEEYRELSGALGSTSQDAVDLQKSIASITVEIENHTKAIEAQAIRNKYQSIVNALELDTLKLTKTTKNYTEELDQQCDIYMNMILKLDSMEEAYKNLSKILGEDADEVQSLQKEIITYNKELDKFCKDCNNKLIDNINKFNSKIKDALKERYTEELKTQEDTINKEISNLNKWKDESIKRIEDVYNAKIKSLDDELKAEDKFEKDREELKKIHQLQESLKYEHNEFNKTEIQKELNRAIADRNKRLHREDIENKKAKLQEDKKNEISNLNNLYESNKANLEKQLEDTKNYYKEKLKLANLEAESQKLIVDNNQKEIVKLIKSYDKDYEQAGKTLGQRLAEGMQEKISPVLDLIDSIQDRINSLRTQEIQASINTAKYSPISSMGNGSINSTTNNSSSTVVNNNNITFNSPKSLTPSEIRRETETTLRNLAFSV
ncbi:phage tail tape measure protein [Clostridium botulinum]|nr:phage tail tape measure protein [Clostridium botulinum]